MYTQTIMGQLSGLAKELTTELEELQADLEDLTDEELGACRKAMLRRVNYCLTGLDFLGGGSNNDD